MSVIEICVVLATIAFIVLVIYSVIALLALRKTLDNVSQLTHHVDTKLEPLSIETYKILQNTQEMTAFVHKQMDSFDPLLKSISSMGSSLQRFSQSFHNDNTHSRRDKIAEISELVALSILVWQQIKKRR